jgi:thiol-disulfide isomerase/thioredoxin
VRCDNKHLKGASYVNIRAIIATVIGIAAIAATVSCSGSADAPTDASPAVADVVAGVPQETMLAETSTTNPATGDSANLAKDFVGVTQWLNSPPLTLEELKGKVVLVEFWTYTCINCLRTLPYLRDWNEKYASRGLVIVGVHSPEFQFEHDVDNVREAMIREQVTWPVAMDNDFATWRAYSNRYWPHKFLIDKDGEVRYHHIGEGAYQETELHIRGYLEEAGYDVSDIPVGGVVIAGEPEQGTKQATREIYAGSGWGRGDYLGNQEKITGGQVATFSDPGKHEGGKFYLQGTWSIDSESVTHSRATEGFEDYIVIKYQAASVNVVVRPSGVDPFRVIATIDGKPIPAADRGDDIMADSQGTTFLQIDGPRMYNVVRSMSSKSGELKLHAGSPDFSLYTYAFSG